MVKIVGVALLTLLGAFIFSNGFLEVLKGNIFSGSSTMLFGLLLIPYIKKAIEKLIKRKINIWLYSGILLLVFVLSFSINVFFSIAS